MCGNGTNGTYNYNIADDGYSVAFRDLEGETIDCRTRARNALDGVLLGPDSYGETNINSDYYKIKLLKARPGERYASSLTNMSLNNKIIRKYGKIHLKDYITSFIKG